jgi:uncharacterized membrane protein (UPF0127 family)
MFERVLTLIVVAIGILVLGFQVFRGNRTNLPTGEVGIGGVRFVVEFADTTLAQARGLMGKDSLGEGRGMLFRFSSPRSVGFWMKGMHFPIDIVWIQAGKIVGFSLDLPPDTKLMPTLYYPPVPVDAVLEISAGSAAKVGMEVGQVVTVTEGSL